MEADKNPFEAVRAMMIDVLDRTQSATQGYLDLFETTMKRFPTANEDQVAAFKAYIEQQVTANHDFVEKLLRAKDFQEAFKVQAEYLQSQMKTAAEDASRIGAKLAGTFNRPPG
jgi:Phasin protein